MSFTVKQLTSIFEQSLHNTQDTQNALIVFLSAVQYANELKLISAFFLIAEIHSTANSKST